VFNKRPKILIVYKCLDYPIRTTTEEHLYSFKRYAQADCFYLMLDKGKELGLSQEPIPEYIARIDFDVILFHYGFMSSRWAGNESFDRAYRQVLPLVNSKAIKAIMPQDEMANTNNLVDFVNKFNIDIVFSVAPETEWPMLYRGVDFSRVKFYKVLTGYLDDRGVDLINKLLRKTTKDIDIGYRARNLPQWLGRHGYMKTLIAEVFNKAVKKFNLKTDISTNPKDTFMGHDWYKFMVRCKYMIGVEGGSTIHDPDGSIAIRSAAYLKEHPDCTFEEIENACFPGLDGKLQLIAISPRNLESCATRTCQVLVESTFNDILKPWVHYIPIKKDLSNIDEVLQIIKDDTKREEITANAYKDIVESGTWSYKGFVEFVINSCSLSADSEYFQRPYKPSGMILRYNHFQDKLAWKKYLFWFKIYHRLPNRWTFIIPIIDLIKFLGLKEPAKRIQLLFKRKNTNTI
jgi:hypothetical protein